MEDNYHKAYAEVIEILKYVPRESVNKIPSSMLELFRTKCDKNYNFKIDITKNFEEQLLLDETKAILANIFRDYWATPEQQKVIIEMEEAERKYNKNKSSAIGESLSPVFQNILDHFIAAEELTYRSEFSKFSDLLGDVPCLRTTVDITFVLDAMHSERYKENVQYRIDDYWYDFMKIYEYNYKTLHSLRIGIVWFNDGRGSSDCWYQRLDFTSFPDEKEKILDYLNNLDDLQISGQRTAMDAVYEAADSDWNQDGEKIRHVIVLITDHEDSLQEECLYYDNVPSLKGFIEDWNHETHNLLNIVENKKLVNIRRFKSLSLTGRRMIIITPPVYPYNEMELECDNIIRYDVQQGKKCEDITLNKIFQLIACSL